MPLMEVDSRQSNGLIVTFVYDSESEECTIYVRNIETSAIVEISVDKDHAADCYMHPSLYYNAAVLV